jgi:hypothetical protein
MLCLILLTRKALGCIIYILNREKEKIKMTKQVVFDFDTGIFHIYSENDIKDIYSDADEVVDESAFVAGTAPENAKWVFIDMAQQELVFYTEEDYRVQILDWDTALESIGIDTTGWDDDMVIEATSDEILYMELV